MKKLIVLILIFSTTALIAHRHPYPGKWTVQGSYLYLMPDVGDTYFVVDDTLDDNGGQGPHGTRASNDFGFHSGFRVGGAYEFCQCDRSINAYYSRLKADVSKTIAADDLWSIVGNGEVSGTILHRNGSAYSKNDILYQRFDLLLDQQLYSCCGLNLSILGGLEYGFYKLITDIEYIRDDIAIFFGTYNEISKTWGIGPQLGLGGAYDICCFSRCCPGILSANFSTSASLLASRRELRNKQNATSSAGITDQMDEPTWRVNPAFHASVGLSYATSFSCFNTVFEIGYEFHTYLNFGAHLIMPDLISPAQSLLNEYNLGLQGLYGSAAFSF